MDDERWTPYHDVSWDSPEAPPSHKMFYLIDNVSDIACLLDRYPMRSFVAYVVGVDIDDDEVLYVTVHVDVEYPEMSWETGS